jgi:hypothetical protein
MFPSFFLSFLLIIPPFFSSHCSYLLTAPEIKETVMVRHKELKLYTVKNKPGPLQGNKVVPSKKHFK